MTEDIFRRIPKNSKNSIAWHMWHCTRIEDIAVNMLVAGNPQIFQSDNWREKMKITSNDTGNAMDEVSIKKLSYSIDIEALRAYRLQVGRTHARLLKKLILNN